MTTLDARFVKQARKRYICEECSRAINADSPYIRMYGMADDNQPPFTIRFHIACANTLPWNDKALKTALVKAEGVL